MRGEAVAGNQPNIAGIRAQEILQQHSSIVFDNILLNLLQ